MSTSMSTGECGRRAFMCGAVAGAAAVVSAPAAILHGKDAGERITAGVIGVHGRGGSLLHGFADLEDVEIGAVCDVDAGVLSRRAGEIEKKTGKRPREVRDFRRVLDDPSIDAVVLGTPDHWHAIPSILACQAGKHVYVEKPASHTILEGRTMLRAARRYRRVMQVGVQSRSGRHFADAMEYIRSGALGTVRMARAWESSKQRSLGHPPDGDPPPGVDYDMWLGPAPKRRFNPLRFHGNWRWFFDYGTGDLGNDGVHRIDYARRGLEAAFEAMGTKLPDWPTAVSASGGKWVFDDAQEWPDTLHVTWEYPQALLLYEMRIWSGYDLEGEHEGAAIYGTGGRVVIGNGSWRAYDERGRKLDAGTSSLNREHDPAHKRSFLDAIRGGGRPSCDIEQGHVSSSMCHMGNTSWRLGRKLRFDPETHSYGNDAEANQLLTRSYRPPWTLPDVS